MRTETLRPAPPLLGLLQGAARRLYPRALRIECADFVNALCTSTIPEFAWQATRLLGDSYRTQVVGAFHKGAIAAEIIITLFCFAAASVSPALIVVLGAILFGLTLRDAYMHPLRGSVAVPYPDPISWSRYYFDSVADATTAAVFLLAAQSLMLRVLPAMAMPNRTLFRAALICLPLLSALRMVWRSRPASGNEEPPLKISGERLYRRTRLLTTLWFAAAFGVMLLNGVAEPQSNQLFDFLLGSLPVVMFGIWFRLQQNALDRDNVVFWLFQGEKHAKGRKRNYLMTGVDKSEPGYPLYIGLQFVCVALLLKPVLTTLWPWLAGDEPNLDYFRLGFNFVVFLTLLLAWNYVKAANVAAAKQLE